MISTDGGTNQSRHITALNGVNRLSGLSRLEHVLQERNIDTVALAFDEADRGECFGVIRVCHEYGVDVLAPDHHHTLTDEPVGKDLVRVTLEPWSWHSRLLKRAFDLAFATVGLVILTPLIALISVAIKVDSSGPVLYGQQRTAEFGATFTVWKFRSMLPESEDARPGDDENSITRVGGFLRQTHLDEIPQLISILAGHMSVVGPRAVWTDEEQLLQREVEGWSRRWHVKPGLTGLAQINDADSTDGQRKLELDVEYIERQSFLLDVRIVLFQIWIVVRDCTDLFTNSQKI